MKKGNILIVLFTVIFIMFLVSCSNNNQLLEISYETPDSSRTMILEGEKYHWIGPKPNNIEADKKIAKVKSLNNSYAYTIKGYNEKDFLIVEERTVGLVLDVYVHESVNYIPWELLEGNVMLEESDYILFNEKKYYYFSKTPSDFSVDKELSQIQKGDKTIKIYKVSNQSENEWIAVMDESVYKQGYLLYWVRETPLPRQYVEFWQNYGR